MFIRRRRVQWWSSGEILGFSSVDSTCSSWSACWECCMRVRVGNSNCKSHWLEPTDRKLRYSGGSERKIRNTNNFLKQGRSGFNVPFSFCVTHPHGNHGGQNENQDAAPMLNVLLKFHDF